MPVIHDNFDLIPPTGGWNTPYNEYDCDGICAGDGDYSIWNCQNKEEHDIEYIAGYEVSSGSQQGCTSILHNLLALSSIKMMGVI